MRDLQFSYRRLSGSPIRRCNASLRRGSILIMVIAILVLMALIGTAYVSVARIDRQAAATGSSNTQNTLQVTAVAQQAESMILNDLFAYTSAGTYYRPAVDGGGNNVNIQSSFAYDPTAIYHDYDSFYDDRDGWMASRLPQQLDIHQPVSESFSAPTGSNGIATLSSYTNPIVWPAISFLQTSSFTTTPYTGVADPTNSQLSMTFNQAKSTYRFAPTWRKINGTNYPAMSIFTVAATDNATLTHAAFSYYSDVATSTTTDAVTTPILAADADGDGIADSLYFKLANQPDPNITYYGAVRIVDSNSAINASTAWSVYSDFDGESGGMPYPTVSPNLGIFASNVGLEEMLRDYIAPVTTATGPQMANYSPNMDKLNQFRFNWSSFSTSGLSSYNINAVQAFNDPGPSSTTKWVASSITPSIFQFITYGDLLEMQLARRLDNPGYYNLGTGVAVQMQALSWSDSAALADRFCLASSSGGTTGNSEIEKTLNDSLMYGATGSNGNRVISSLAYDPSAIYTSTLPGVGDWYNDNFDFDDAEITAGYWNVTTANYLPRRALIVAKSPVSDNVPWDTRITWNPAYGTTSNTSMNGNQVDPASQGAYKPPCRANLNTAPYTDLYNAFLGVMLRADTVTANAVPAAGSAPFTPFRGTFELNTALATQQLRASIAAQNTIAMRTTAGTISSQATNLKLADGTTVVTAYTYGLIPQPYIVEAVLNEINGSGYMAIELYNPTQQVINMTGWELVDFTSGSVPGSSFSYTFPSGTNIALGGYLVIESGGSSASPPAVATDGTNTTTPGDLTAPTSTVTTIVIPTLTTANMNHHFVLIRPTNGAASIAAMVPADYAPVDQIDFHNYLAGGSSTNAVHMMYYRRQLDNWEWVYPGASTGLAAPALPAPGTSVGSSTGAAGVWNVVTFTLEPDGKLHGNPDVNAYNSAIGDTLGSIEWNRPSDPGPTITTTPHAIPLGTDLNTYPGPNPAAAPYKYPFGAFARDGDAFNIPFIGSYVITPSGSSSVLEMNGVSYDSSYAEDGDPNDDGYEMIGRFCPVGDPSSTAPATQMDYDRTPGGTLITNDTNHRYYFARFLLDYVGALNTPNSDDLPNVSTNTYASAQDVPNNANSYPPPNPKTGTTTNWANHGLDGSNVYNNEYNQPISGGMININTAPWRVLAMLPMVGDNANKGNFSTTTAQTDNILLAKAIVAYRDKYGPFTSIFDLNRVFDPSVSAPSLATPGFCNGWNTIGSTTGSLVPSDNGWTLAAPPTYSAPAGGTTPAIGPAQRDFTNVGTASPAFPRATTSSPVVDFNYMAPKDRLNMITRISNLVTTRSDSFTVYVLVEGWKNAGTSSATRVSQVRQAYIVDRSQVSGLNKTLNIIPVPTN